MVLLLKYYAIDPAAAQLPGIVPFRSVILLQLQQKKKKSSEHAVGSCVETCLGLIIMTLIWICIYWTHSHNYLLKDLKSVIGQHGEKSTNKKKIQLVGLFAGLSPLIVVKSMGLNASSSAVANPLFSALLNQSELNWGWLIRDRQKPSWKWVTSANSPPSPTWPVGTWAINSMAHSVQICGWKFFFLPPLVNSPPLESHFHLLVKGNSFGILFWAPAS